MIRCAPGKVKWNKPISAGTYDRQVLILVDKSRPLLTNSRHKTFIRGRPIARWVPLPFKRLVSSMMAKGGYSFPRSE